MTDQYFDDVLGRLERGATPDGPFADRLFSQLAVEAGLGRRRWFNRIVPELRRVGDLPRATRLAWIALALGALLTLLTGLLWSGGSPRPVIETVTGPTAAPVSAEPDPSSSVLPMRPQSTVLQVGGQAPTWTGRLLDGGSFSTDDLRGRPAAILLWCSCVSGEQARHFLEEARRRDDVAMVLVSLDEEGTTQGLADAVGGAAHVVMDDEDSMLEDWALSFFPALVLLRADGTVADLHPMTFDADSLRDIVDRLAAGAAIPEPAPFPSPPVDDAGRQPLSTVLEVGEPAPELAGPALGGGELSTRELIGRPTAVLHWLPPRLDGTPQEDAPPPDALLQAAQDRSGDLNLLLIARGEPEPGAAAAYLVARGSNVPVIFDWDGALHQRWGLVMFTTLVLLNADGTVAGYFNSSALGDPAPVLDALLAGEPLPSPALFGP